METRRANIINFIRGIEPREPAPDILEPLVKQVELVKKHRLPATWLVQYDAMLDSRFTDILQNLGPEQEIGVWLEMSQPQVEAVGIEWRGRYPWDWHADVGFAEGYLPNEREMLIDRCMQLFRQTFGTLPKTVGCWMLDAHTLGYLHSKYGIIGACNCKEQFGTDGYTLWGGYFAGGYYPSKKHALMPAQSAQQQIDVPVFRMLGSDPIYQYDSDVTEHGQKVVTLEPVYKEGGGSLDWIRWFFDTTFKTPHLALAYAQIGQENSFGWPAMEYGLTKQLALLEELKAGGGLIVETLRGTSEWFANTYKRSPATASVALEDWKGEGRKSVWYSSHRYRIGLYWDKAGFRIRDIHLFDENFPQRYLTDRCTSHSAFYETLPVMEGLLWSDAESKAGITLDIPGVNSSDYSDVKVAEQVDSLSVLWNCGGRRVEVVCQPEQVCLSVSGAADWAMDMRLGKKVKEHISNVDSSGVDMVFRGHSYRVKIDCKALTMHSDTVLRAKAKSGGITFNF